MVTLTGTFTRLDGTPATGTVKVTPSRSPIMDPDGKVVISGPQTFPLGVDGTLSVPIPASNDPDLGPAFTYWIDVNLTHANWKISKVWIPHGSTTVDLSEIADYTPTPGVATRVVTIPADGTDGQVLVWDGAGFSWDFPPTGPQGPKGDLDAEQLAGAPRLTNLAHDITWVADGGATINSQVDRTVTFTATAQSGHIRRDAVIYRDVSYYFTAEVKTTSDQVFFGTSVAPVYHSGSGDWERLTGRVTLVGNTYFLVRDTRSSGWDQIEVRDPVLIDLTAVFGAGREPTTEYMDALLAKHGNYVGGVDQFAVGDALQALTVAGPGMTLRHDTSVGERVLLDHPGGTTMLYGDTGWRNIKTTANLHASLTLDTLQITRTDNLVTLHATNVAATTQINFGKLFEIPDGFRPSRSMFLYGTENTYIDVSPVGTAFATIGESPRRFSLQWHTTNPWPTVLPGLPL